MFERLKEKYYEWKLRRTVKNFNVTDDSARLYDYCIDKLNGKTYKIIEFDEQIQKLANEGKTSIEEAMLSTVMVIEYIRSLKGELE